MIHESALDHFRALAEFYKPRMLMLGATGSTVAAYPRARDFFAEWVGNQYDDLDLDGGDLKLDLNTDIGIDQAYGSVFNVGTIEHCWHVSQAFENALKAVAVGGYFLSTSPFRGFETHGLHITNPAAIKALLMKNGFDFIKDWVQTWPSGKTVYWLAAQKIEHKSHLAPPMQVYEAGQKKMIC